MRQIVVNICMLIITSHFLNSNIRANDIDNLSVRLSYGTNQLLPSLISNANLDFDTEKSYFDFYTEGGFQISEKLSFQAAVQATDQPNAFIGTNYSRPDLPITTGRVQKSVVNYRGDDLRVSFGRNNVFSGERTPSIFQHPLNSDGLCWSYKWASWSFKHFLQILPAQSKNNEVFRRSISYHHLSKSLNGLTLGVGEYFILTGDQIGFDLKRLNPFIPYLLNSFDSKADLYPGYTGDSDNSLIKLFLEWQGISNRALLNVYIDEFQVDAVDREANSDALMLHLSVETTFNALGHRNMLNWGLSISNPNFGQHPGPFTTSTLGIFPLFEFTPGMKNLVFIENKSFIGETWQISLAGYSERWVDISQLSPAQMNQHESLDPLEVNSDSRLGIEVNYTAKKLPLNVGLLGWTSAGTNSQSGYLVSLNYDFESLIKR